MAKETNPWVPRGNDEIETFVNGHHLVVFPTGAGRGWCVALDGEVLRQDHDRHLHPSKKHAQDHAIAVAEEDHTV